MARSVSTREKRSRLPPDVRRAQILDATARLVLVQGHLPIPLPALAEAAGTSKALIYAYFPTQHDLANSLVARRFAVLLAAGLAEAIDTPDLREAALRCAALYFAEVAGTGPLVHVILRDPYMAGRLDPGLARTRDALVRTLARRVRRDLGLSAKEAVAAISLMTTIPEEAGRLVYRAELARARGEALTAQLIASSFDALKSPQPG